MSRPTSVTSSCRPSFSARSFRIGCRTSSAESSRREQPLRSSSARFGSAATTCMAAGTTPWHSPNPGWSAPSAAGGVSKPGHPAETRSLSWLKRRWGMMYAYVHIFRRAATPRVDPSPCASKRAANLPIAPLHNTLLGSYLVCLLGVEKTLAELRSLACNLEHSRS